MIRRPPRSTQSRSSAASDVYKRQRLDRGHHLIADVHGQLLAEHALVAKMPEVELEAPVSYTHLRAHETVLDLVCRLLLEKKNKKHNYYHTHAV